jgi:hypothetical protein
MKCDHDPGVQLYIRGEWRWLKSEYSQVRMTRRRRWPVRIACKRCGKSRLVTDELRADVKRLLLPGN